MHWRAGDLARRLGVAESPPKPEGNFVLEDPGHGLQLRETAGTLGRPLRVDFDAPAVTRRIREGRRQPLARAIGLKGGPKPTILDVTGGLGADAFVLAGLGCQVHLMERSGPVWALLMDGLRRTRRRSTAERIRLEYRDALEDLASLTATERPDVIYLDPMYPAARRALAGRQMQFLRALVGPDADSPALLAAALGHAGRRVVVKRPRHAPPLGDEHPSFSLDGSSTRFDIYLIQRGAPT